MRASNFARLFILSGALSLPGMAVAQFPYSAWTCARPAGEYVCSPAIIPPGNESVVWELRPPEAPEAPALEEPLSEEKLDVFVNVFTKIEAISQDFTNSYPKDGNVDDTKSIREAAHRKALEAIQNASMSLSKYNEIAAFLSKETELRRRVIPPISQS